MTSARPKARPRLEGVGQEALRTGRIVDRHKGDISIQTRPGETVLRVRLPARGADTAPRVTVVHAGGRLDSEHR